MQTESRVAGRESIHLEEIVGAFQLDTGVARYDRPLVCDVSVSGAGIELSTPLEVGSNIDLTFVAGDWRISVEGKVMWCSVETNEQNVDENYRVGVKFNPENTNNNVMFFMACRSMVRPAV